MERDSVMQQGPFSWTLREGLEPVEPARPLLPGDVGDPREPTTSNTIVATFASQVVARDAAQEHGGIAVGCSVLVPGLAEADEYDGPWDTSGDIPADFYDVGRKLKDAGAVDVFVSAEGGGYLTLIDIRATARDQESAVRTARLLTYTNVPVSGLIEPWAPGAVLTDENIAARLYVQAMMQTGTPVPAVNDIERAVARAWQGHGNDGDEGALRSLLGAHDDDLDSWRQSRWYGSYLMRIDGTEISIGSLWFLHLSLGFPAFVRWLNAQGIVHATYDIHNVVRP